MATARLPVALLTTRSRLVGGPSPKGKLLERDRATPPLAASVAGRDRCASFPARVQARMDSRPAPRLRGGQASRGQALRGNGLAEEAGLVVRRKII